MRHNLARELAQTIPCAPGARRAGRPIRAAHRRALAPIAQTARRAARAACRRIVHLGRVAETPARRSVIHRTGLRLLTTAGGRTAHRLTTAAEVTPRHTRAVRRAVILRRMVRVVAVALMAAPVAFMAAVVEARMVAEGAVTAAAGIANWIR